MGIKELEEYLRAELEAEGKNDEEIEELIKDFL